MKRILCIRPDHMGDVLMSTPAIRALKETFRAHIALLTSAAGAAIAPAIPEIDHTIVFDVPWVPVAAGAAGSFNNLVQLLKHERYDAAVIFTVYSQNPLPAALLAYMAGIPVRLAYCRENPYQLLTHWLPDDEPYRIIRHQVQRDLRLVALIGAHTKRPSLSLRVDKGRWPSVKRKLRTGGLDLVRPWLVLHPGVSEARRQYPLEQWIKAAQLLQQQLGMQLVITGNPHDAPLAATLQQACGAGCVNMAGKLNITEFITLVGHSRLVLSVNTVTPHIAAAAGTPVVVLYARTNPQHTPWQASSAVLYFDATEAPGSKNEVVRFVRDHHWPAGLPEASPESIVRAVAALYHSPVCTAASSADAAASTA